MTHQSDVLFETLPCNQGYLGQITLNRSQALNALTHDMVRAIDRQLQRWQWDDAIHAVIMRANGERVFCAGGDIRYLYAEKKHPAKLMQFFHDEYILNRRIRYYAKPYIALMDGLTMGGGVGITLHGAYRIGAENFLFAMPEAGIGFFPDVGGSYLLSRCSNYNGVYLALTGSRINVGDALFLNLIDTHIARSDWDKLLQALTEANWHDDKEKVVSEIIKKMVTVPTHSAMNVLQIEINKHFSFQTIEEIMDSLQADPSEWSQKTLGFLQKNSPTSLKVILRSLTEAVNCSFDECMQMEYRLSRRFMEGHDFYEGVRAAVIDKDQQAKWQPEQISQVTDEIVQHYFEPLDIPELKFSL